MRAIIRVLCPDLGDAEPFGVMMSRSCPSRHGEIV